MDSRDPGEVAAEGVLDKLVGNICVPPSALQGGVRGLVSANSDATLKLLSLDEVLWMACWEFCKFLKCC